MEYVAAEVEIDGVKIEEVTSIALKQRFNEHHEFSIRIDYDVIEKKDNALSLSTAQKKIGKTVIIRFLKVEESNETAYEFRGIVCEVRLEQSAGFDAELILSGYSPTILLESGADCNSFNREKLKAIVTKVTSSIGGACQVQNNPAYSSEILYKCQYRESAFNFLNRLSSDYGEYFYYDGKDLNFGKPSSAKKFSIVNGEDVNSLQLSLSVLPVNFSNYFFDVKADKRNADKTTGNINGLGQYAGGLVKEAKNLFSNFVMSPSGVHAENISDLKETNRIKQAAAAANMEVLNASSFNPFICIGSIVNLKISVPENGKYTQSDYGEFLVTSIEHFISGNNAYHNSFEAIPSSLNVVPVTNFSTPVAETQVAAVLKNDDEDKMGRVQVQMLWQTDKSGHTDWIRVMAPDAGQGDKGKNRGLVAIPEVGDQVVVGFRYNDPDRPFVLGSFFTGKTGEGGGDKNEIKSFTTKSGSTVKFEKDKVSIIDAKEKSKVLFDGEGKMTIESEEEINIKCGQSTISMKKDGTIQVKGKEITLDATSKATMKSMQASFMAESSGDAKMAGTNASVSAQVGAKVQGNATAEISASGQTTVKGAIVMIN